MVADKELEREAYELLKTEFDKVIWLSKKSSSPKQTYSEVIERLIK